MILGYSTGTSEEGGIPSSNSRKWTLKEQMEEMKHGIQKNELNQQFNMEEPKMNSEIEKRICNSNCNGFNNKSQKEKKLQIAKETELIKREQTMKEEHRTRLNQQKEM